MRKIYSLVLMAAMLFVGTNAWAKDFSSGFGSDLQDAINLIMAGTESDPVIKLTQPVTLNSPIWIGTVNLDDPYRSITLDLNGHDITMAASKTTQDANGVYNMFVLTHGELKVINSSATEAKLLLSGSGNNYSDVFFLTGSYRSSGWNEEGTAVTGTRINTRTSGYFTHLEIGERVVIKIEDQGTGININNILSQTTANYFTLPVDSLSYRTDFGSSSQGFLYGARVDLKGKIEILGSTCVDDNPSTTTVNEAKGKIYGIKINGTVQSPSNINTKDFNTVKMNGVTVPYLQNYKSKLGKAEDADPNHMLDTTDAPFIHIYPQASITTGPKGAKSAPVYASGYAKWLIEGTCKGKTGIYISSGVVALNNANVSSNSENFAAASKDGGANAAGSGVVVNSRGGSYSGDINVTVSGDTKIEGTTGYAVAEYVNTSKDTVRNPETGQLDTVQNTKVQSIVINGGTFEGGDKGAIIVSAVTSEAAQQSDSTKVVIYGGNVNGEAQVGTSGDIDDITPSGYHNTEVTNADGTTTVVISQGSDPTPKTTWADVVTASDQENPNDVKWEEVNVPATIGDGTTNTTLYFGEMQIISGKKGVGGDADTLQELTISNKATLYVNRLILNDYARITVEAGGKLIVTGSQGINAPVPENILLKANATDQATFVISPDVTSNKQPNATVQLYTTCYKDGENSWKWQRFASPLTKTTTVTNDHDGSVGSSIKYIDDATEVWTNISAWSDLRPFTACAITNQLSAGGVTYSFPGKLMGNVTDSITRKACKWNYYGNSFMAPMSVKALSNALPVQNVDPAIYYWDVTAQGYKSVTAQMIGDFTFGILTEIPAMGFFVLKNTAQEAGALNIDYNNSIFRHAQGLAPVYNAPVRQTSNSDRVCISVVAENGYSDVVYLLGSDNFTPEYEAGADVEKLMNNCLNLYVAGDINLSALYTDNLLGATLTLQSNEAINYSMSFNNVNGEYALRDNMTGRTIAIVEGATYNFSAQPNETIEGRFQIVGRQEMPTAVEMVEEMVNTPKAIYTVMGQYVGETTDWNNLPAGVYVVDGVKVIK